mmetsp:Transcript_35378/g.86983  ORF Transcript_35378/g.86983 Transcript_35378/m.86983 type:complete len:222 (+) Transcript_35378:161-826(+)|eukprot:CAMPEP_0206239088 /NCGR_PEP_ID=MMETSP0047_2-20121206/15184_1 /ASSEMBLY_ACC=CAM_ASM_000192 /TAXON_ID=195065 /ORGANISM="Chroomonas mesostigmatica_cf, Strain CCMP1168" /LENGTH=221 /DNA_ID=CAMNT_0053663711 /DNA_START=161 /DNA_END=826 /DNA_ORIENTATION=+
MNPESFSGPFFPTVLPLWTSLLIQSGAPRALYGPSHNVDLRATDFVDTANAFMPFFDHISQSGGSAIFGPVKKDMRGNIERVERALAAHGAGASIRDLMQAESARGTAPGTVADALLWWRRAMSYIVQMLRGVSKGEEASQAMKDAYHLSLSKHHGRITRAAFELGMRVASADTEAMIKGLGGDKDTVLRQMREWIDAADPCLRTVGNILRLQGHAQAVSD